LQKQLSLSLVFFHLEHTGFLSQKRVKKCILGRRDNQRKHKEIDSFYQLSWDKIKDRNMG